MRNRTFAVVVLAFSWALVFMWALFAVAVAELRSVHGPDLPEMEDGRPEIVQLCGHLYHAAYDTERKAVVWIAYRVRQSDWDSGNTLSRRWLKCPWEETSLEPEDYTSGQYDIGHMVPLASFRASQYAFELNYFPVTAPQTPELNRGPWLQFENRTRELSRSGPVYVLAGSLWAEPMPRLENADESHMVPSHYWATISQQGREVESYLMPQATGGRRMEAFRTSGKDLMARTGLTWGYRLRGI